ncbi:MAG: hypothetical protein K5840_00120 [Eubacterium sp.]|nr:hypothetical protein [Eubacterium sp.]
MAVKKKKASTEGYVTVNLPRPAKGEPDAQFVAVNGKTYRIKKGQKVKVPRSVAEVIKNSEIAKDEANVFIDGISM